MRAFIVCALILTSLAGCADTGPTQEEPEIFQEVKTTSDKGVIRGIVVNENIVPVEGASVLVMPGDMKATTDKDGAFVMTDVEPGVYFLTAKAADHGTTQTSVEVKAGVEKPDIVRMMIAYVPPPVPMWQELTYKFSTAGSGWVGGVGGIVFFDPTGEGHFSNSFEIEGNTTWYQSELVWTPQQPLSASLRLYSGLSGEDMSASKVVAGQSPLLTTYTDEDITTKGPMTQGNTMYVDNGELPAGVAVYQQATLYAHAFQNWMPPEGWRFTDDESLRPPA